MDKEIKTSFIPKQPAIQTSPHTRKKGESLLFTVSLILLLISIAFYGGLYLYLSFLNSSIERPCPSDDPRSLSGCGMKASLLRVRNSIDQDSLIKFKRTDAKLKAADVLLSRHATLNGFFDRLSENTVQTVRFTNLDLKNNVVVMKGVAESYEDIALQSASFARDKTIKGFIFSDLNLNDRGEVVFSLSLSLSPEAVSYVEYLNTKDLNQENI